MLGSSGLTDLHEESSHQVNKQTLVGIELGSHAKLWAPAAEQRLACLLSFLGFGAPVV